MSAASVALRTYGKRQGNKRKQLLATPSSGDRDSTPSPSPSKRRRISGEKPSPVETEEDADTEVDEATPTKPKSSKMHGAPMSKPVRDLSIIFNTISPAPSPSATPTKLARRMLGRSKTDASLENQLSPRIPQVMDRTSSLPNLPSSPQSPMNPPAAVPRSSTPSTLPSSKPAATKTYAGKYRSFLVALPASSSSASALLGPGLETEDESRESYSSLRNRWGVDNSEDDPHPFEMVSPTKPALSVEDSPSKNGKGKSKSVLDNRALSVMMPLKSISELRNKGESRRFLDEVGYLFEGLDPKCAIGLRRARYIPVSP